MPPAYHDDGYLLLDHDVDLHKAIRAEVVFEMVQSHEDTKGLAISINRQESIQVADLSTLPRPQSAYMLHTFPRVEVPLEHLKGGRENRFKLEVDTMQKWNWPQHIFYGIIFRIYYEDDKITPTDLSIQGINDDDWIGLRRKISIADTSEHRIYRVDYQGLYEDFDWDGNGVYREWQGHTHRGILRNHIGHSITSPFAVDWETEWLPDQPKPMQLMARIEFEDGIVLMTKAVKGLQLARSYAVELCKPYHQPENWVTRSDTFQAHFAAHGNLAHAESYQVAWRSWSPCYGRGVWINDQKIWDREDPCYGYAEHLIEVNDIAGLTYGENTITTGKTPLIDGKMVHGMEVQYPGIMVKVRYAFDGVQIKEGSYEGRPHLIVHTPGAIYYYDKAGGGFSRIIDRDGRDWIDFKMQPWGTYPEAAASAFRGVPNFVHGSDDAGAGHPGHGQCESKMIDERTILTESKSKKWQWRWTFESHFARVEMTRTDPNHRYWFLYEGVPGGRFDPKRQYFGTNAGGPRSEQRDYYKGDKVFEYWQWVYFGHEDVDRVLFIGQQGGDDHTDTFGYLGNSTQGIGANDGMVVFGFGRADGAKPLLTGPNIFYLGFLEQSVRDAEDHRVVAKQVQVFSQ